MDMDWDTLIPEQLDWHWRENLRPRWEGLTDEEYFWEPVPGMWSIRPRGSSTAPSPLGGGKFTCDFSWPAPDPPPATTIAWRMAHLLVGVFGARVASHFGGPPVSFQEYDYPGDAATALARLDAAYAAWDEGVRGLGADGLARPIGPAGGPLYAAEPMASLILHINREALHHGSEICLLRDLYRWKA